MRTTCFLALALAACSPQISDGAYDCGPNGSCPPTESCNVDATCVATGTQTPFSCDPSTLHEPQGTPAQAFAIALDGCVSSVVEDDGCLQKSEAADWVSFATPSNCAAVAVQANLIYPMAFEPLALKLTDATGATMLAASGECAQDPTANAGDLAVCLTLTLANAMTYALEVSPTGEDDCGGECNFNTYSLTLQLVTP
jgi:hypothetical protein